MATITETIRDELLGAVDDLAGLEKVIHDHNDSKSCLYSALAKATATMTDKLKALSEEYKAAQKGYHELNERFKSAEQGLGQLNQGIALKNKEMATLDEKVKERKALLDQAKALRGLSFGAAELGKLHEILVQISASQGNKPEEAVKLFFQAVDRYEKIVSLELEIERVTLAINKARAEVERWQAESKAAEARCKGRKSSIDITDQLLAQGIKESDLAQWTHILAKSSVAPEKLAMALESFASIQKLYQDRQEQVKKLEKLEKELASQVKALTEERDGISTAIVAIRDKALVEIDRTSRKTLENLNALMDQARAYAELEHQAGALEQELNLARAFKGENPELWKQIHCQGACNLVNALLRWCRADATHNLLLPSPTGSLGSKILLCSFQQASLEEVLGWMLTGILATEGQNRKVVPSG